MVSVLVLLCLETLCEGYRKFGDLEEVVDLCEGHVGRAVAGMEGLAG